MRGLETWVIAAIVAAVVVAAVAGVLLLKPKTPEVTPTQPENKTQKPGGGEQPGGGEEQPQPTTEADKVTVATPEEAQTNPEKYVYEENPEGYWGVDKVGLKYEDGTFKMEVLVSKDAVSDLASKYGESTTDVVEHLKNSITAWVSLGGENVNTQVVEGNVYYKFIITGDVKDKDTLNKIVENLVLG